MDNGGTDSTLERLFYHTDRVRLVHWHAVSGARTAVVLTGATTVLAFVTGMSILSAAEVTIAGPVAQLVPGMAGFVRFAGVLCAFILGLLTVGLRRRKRLAWYLTVVMLPLTAVVPLTTLRPSDVPLLVLVACTFPLLVLNRGQFDRTLDITALQSSALAAFAGALFYGVIGSYAQRSDFVGLETWSDAIYYVIVTIATVGYGDVRPTTTETKWFSLSVIMFGTAAFTVAVGSLIAPAIEKRLSAAFGNMKPSELTLLEDHVIVLGHGDFTESLLDELGDETDVVVVTDDTDAASALESMGVNVLTADPTAESSLRDASIDTATGVVAATRNDATDVMAILAARRANPDVRIVAAASEAQNVEKMQEVGTDHVISPTEIGGRFLGRSVLDGTPDESTTPTVLADDGE